MPNGCNLKFLGQPLGMPNLIEINEKLMPTRRTRMLTSEINEESGYRLGLDLLAVV